MRHEAAPAELVVWRCLRDRQLNGLKFRRQKAIGPFIADFVCTQVKLVIELDGDSHSEREKYDEDRTELLKTNGYEVIRFSNVDVFEHLDDLLEEILGRCEQLAAGSPSP